MSEPLFGHPCAIDSCDREGVNVLAVRLRRPDGTAIWAPNSSALLCERCSTRGLRVELHLDPLGEPLIELACMTRGGEITRRTLLKDAGERPLAPPWR